MASVYTIIHESNKAGRESQSDLQAQLEKGRDETKIEVMRTVLTAMYNGDPLPGLLMHVIRFVMPSRNKELKKLLQLYWEVVPKLGPDGKLKHEMILVINAIRNDLQHPNEYIRGGTLRYLAKLREHDLLEPLVPSVRACLDHRHAYVRKNAVFSIMAIAQNLPELVPDAAEIVAEFLEAEGDATCKRNAFVALTRLDRDAAYSYFQKNYTDFGALDELLQLAFVEFIRKDAAAHPELLHTYVQVLGDLLENATNVVAYDAASALGALTASPAALTKVASKYVTIAVKEADNNIKIIALNRVAALNDRAPGALSSLTMDVLLVLNSPDVDVRGKALDLAMDLVNSRNVESVVRLLKKELAATVGQNYDKNAEYRQAIIAAIHKIAVQFADITASVVGLLLDFLGDFNTESAVEVVKFVREVVEMFPNLRAEVLGQLINALTSIQNSSVFLGVLWVVGEYCTTEDEVKRAWVGLRKALGPLPIRDPEDEVPAEQRPQEETEDSEAVGPKKSTKPRVLADGTYATESALDAAATPAVATEDYPLRKLILEGKYFLAGALAATLTKLVLRAARVNTSTAHVNGMTAEALLAMTSILRSSEGKIDEDSFDRIYSCIQILLDGDKEIEDRFLDESHKVFAEQLQKEKAEKAARKVSEMEKRATAVDRPVKFRLFESLGSDLAIANVEPVSAVATQQPEDRINSQLKHIYQLTGYSDPIYAEAHMTVHQFDITLDVMLFNQTTETLQNLSVEFFTVGNITVVEEPTTQNIPPMSFYTVQTTIKVSSADSGVIFGNIIYEGKSSSEATVVILNEIRLNVLDYIKPAYCTDNEFRKMWTVLEWENKVSIKSSSETLSKYLETLLKETNMACLTKGALDAQDDSQFLSANLYARSTFGEDALANVSIELRDGIIAGHLRIRAKKQGPAISIGDRVTAMQRHMV